MPLRALVACVALTAGAASAATEFKPTPHTRVGWLSLGPSIGASFGAPGPAAGALGATLTAGVLSGSHGVDPGVAIATPYDLLLGGYWGFGLYGEADWVFSRGLHAGFGAQLNWSFIGLELGGALQLFASAPPQWAVQVAPFLTVGYVDVRFRIDVPIDRLHPVTGWVMAGIKLPLLLASTI